MKQLIFAVLLYGLCIPLPAATDSVIFAGGCFWCMEPPFDKLDGVIRTTSGYSGGHTENPTYKTTSTGQTGHYEVLQVNYDPQKISYEKLLDVFWKNIDLFDAQGQFCDKGPQYRAAIFVKNHKEQQLSSKSKAALQEKLKDKATIVTEILPAKKFYPAEDYHQNYYQKNPLRYKYYRYSCGRDKRLRQIKELLGSS